MIQLFPDKRRREKQDREEENKKGIIEVIQKKNIEKQKKSPRSREVCSTDHLLAEVKVPTSAPGGPPWHSSLSFSSGNKKHWGCSLTHMHS